MKISVLSFGSVAAVLVVAVQKVESITLRGSVAQKLLSIQGGTGFCNAVSSNCGAVCSTTSDCPGGDCWAAKQACDNTGFCNAASGAKCGNACGVDGQCDQGACWTKRDTCSGPTPTMQPGSTPAPVTPTTNDKFIGTYIGALPGGLKAPSFSSLSDNVNLIMLSFATDDSSHSGQFSAFAPWAGMGINYNSIAESKKIYPGRKFLISLGGAADYGGTFSIGQGVTVDQWVATATKSVADIVNAYGADGVELQFEGGTGDVNFNEAMTKLLANFKNDHDFFTAIGPFYGGTSSDYGQLDRKNVDVINCQMYAMNHNTDSTVEADVKAAVAEFGGDWSKFVLGLSSNHRNPDPTISLDVIKAFRNQLGGMFTWDAEHDVEMKPPNCLQDNSAALFSGSDTINSCEW